MMSRGSQIGSELNSIVRNKKVVIPVIAVMLIPLLYSALFLGAFWDPYVKLDKIPVAIVNEDVGVEYNGEQMTIGDEFVDQLKESGDFNYEFVSKQEAVTGLKDNYYYIMIEIPQKFSEQAVSLVGDHPEQAELIYTPNEGYNFLAGQIGGTATAQMTTLLNQQISKTYVSSIYDQIGEALEGIQAASEGAHQIADGTDSAKTGATKLLDGQQTLADGLIELQTGAAQLNTAGTQLSGGLATLQTGGTNLNNGLSQLAEGAKDLDGGISQLSKQYASLDTGLNNISEGTTSLKQGAMQLQAGLQQLASQNSELAASESFQQLIAGSEQLVNGLLAQESGESQLITGSSQVVNGLSSLSSGSNQLVTKFTDAKQGANQLVAGITSASEGSSELAKGLQSLKGSSDKFVSGSKELVAGNKELVEGLTTLDEGANELATKLGDANGESLNLTLTEQMKEQFVEPVVLTTSSYSDVPNYGTGFAPYFISLGLYVGCMLLTVVYSMREPSLKPHSGRSWYAGKTAVVGLIAILQAIILGLSILPILNLEVMNLGAFFLFTIITSLTYMMLIQLLCVTMDNVGRFIAIVLLILQLTSSAGTFPIELVPNWLQAINPFLPMTYTVTGFKQAISSGDMGLFWSSVWPLLALMISCSLLSYIYMKVSFKKKFQTITE
ncbi:MAG TPA: YhgE/Pip domain-containing protein [Candidatus Paenibacillus intestinavium]|nr:YhgE/Pip domain-containing protein [Candidatus Paenibacillus intestinavium]